ncbi:MAG TPA: D-alanine--D-alanine ligase A [Clostridiales bacterium]|nr:D-alanine--D-alanine ligase A [Clostridiales bacterium]
MNKIKIGVIFGGMSTEHNVSNVSGTSVIQNLNREKYEIYPIYISKGGKWFRYIKPVEEIKILQIGEEPQELDEIKNPLDFLKKLDVIFPVLHGLYGEDGTIQGLLELINVPYVGCKVLGACNSMDKVYTKIILDKAKIKQVKYAYIRKNKDAYIYVDEKFNETTLSLNEISEKISKKIDFPVFVKPSNSGSSVGVEKAINIDELKKAIEFASQYDVKILIEQGIDARELECGILGNEDVEASCVGEILPAEEFYSYDAKYKNDDSRVVIPANITEEQANEIRHTAMKAFKALDAKGLSRVDFFIDRKTGDVYLNEINTMPGFTEISMYPKLWEKSGISYSELLDKLISLAM